MRTRALLLVSVLACLLTACGVGGTTPEELATANEVIRSVNDARAGGVTCGDTVQPATNRLALNTLLLEAAKAHSEDMLAAGKLTHTGSDGSNPGQRIARTGYDAATWGENAAVGYGSPDSVMAGWLGSPGHCRNIMNPAFTEIAVARAGSYWTMVLARPR